MHENINECMCTQGSLHGVLPCEDRMMGGLKMEPVAWSSDMRKSIALCNDLVPVGSRNVSGHADERRAFIDVEAAFLVRPICLLHITESAFLGRLCYMQGASCMHQRPHNALDCIQYCISSMSTLHRVVPFSILCRLMLGLPLTIIGQYLLRYWTRPQRPWRHKTCPART